MHPLIDLSALSTEELENKTSELMKKISAPQSFGLRQQAITILNLYREELITRRNKALDEMLKTRNLNVEKLVRSS